MTNVPAFQLFANGVKNLGETVLMTSNVLMTPNDFV
jgi:hypothetical protein